MKNIVFIALIACSESLRLFYEGSSSEPNGTSSEEAPDLASLLSKAQALGRDPNYHAWVDATLKKAQLPLTGKEEWNIKNERNAGEGGGIYWHGHCLVEPEESDMHLWEDAAKAMKTPLHFHRQCHRKLYGGGWTRQSVWLDFAIKFTGLKPDQKFFDVGCGAMRLGIPMTRYLDSGNYYGLDVDTTSLRAAIQYEVPMADLMEKKPSLIRTTKFEMSQIVPNNSIDVVGAFVILKKKEFYSKFFQEAFKVLKKGGHVIAVQGNKDCHLFEREFEKELEREPIDYPNNTLTKNIFDGYSESDLNEMMIRDDFDGTKSGMSEREMCQSRHEMVKSAKKAGFKAIKYAKNAVKPTNEDMYLFRKDRETPSS